MPDEDFVLCFCEDCGAELSSTQALRKHRRFAHPLPRAKEDKRRIKFVEAPWYLPGFEIVPEPPKGR